MSERSEKIGCYAMIVAQIIGFIAGIGGGIWFAGDHTGFRWLLLFLVGALLTGFVVGPMLMLVGFVGSLLFSRMGLLDDGST